MVFKIKNENWINNQETRGFKLERCNENLNKKTFKHLFGFGKSCWGGGSVALTHK